MARKTIGKTNLKSGSEIRFKVKWFQCICSLWLKNIEIATFRKRLINNTSLKHDGRKKQ